MKFNTKKIRLAGKSKETRAQDTTINRDEMRFNNNSEINKFVEKSKLMSSNVDMDTIRNIIG